MNPQHLTRIGPYPVVRFIAEGGMAYVFEVTDPRFDVSRALKLLKPEAARGQEFQRFREEAAHLARIDHPNLITIYDFGQDEETGCHYYTMGLVDGPVLSHMGALPPERGVPIVLGALSALSGLHDANIIHRDIKPSNILIAQDGRAMLGDLGIARSQDQATGLTRTGVAIGTVSYMSPEQARGRPVGPASDVFSMGLTLYRILVGASVYDGIADIDSSSDADVMFYLGSLVHAGGEIDLRFPKDVPKPIQAVIRKACRFNVDERYANAREMYAALEAAIREPTGPQPRPHRWLLPASIAMAMMLVAGVGYLVWQSGAEESRARDELARVAALDESVVGLLEDASTLQPMISPALLASAQRGLSVAQSYLQRARGDLESERYLAALTSLELAGQDFEVICNRITDEYLAPQLGTTRDELEARVSALAGVDAGRYAPDRFRALESAMAGIAPVEAPLSACDQAVLQRDQLRGAERVAELAALVAQDLQSEWPRLAESARGGALDSRERARSESVDAEPYAAALARGKQALASGDAARERGEHLAAVDAYGRARQAFEEAIAVVPAAQARERVRGLERAVAQRTISDVGIVKGIVEEADTQFAGEHWAAATDAYGQAVALYVGLLENAERSRAARSQASAADAARFAALEARADNAAEAQLLRADEVREAARAELGAKDFAAAESRFAEAASLYAEARKQAAQVIAEAEAEAREVRTLAERVLKGRRCDALPELARADCESATRELAEAEAELEEGYARPAIARFGTVRASFATLTQAEKSGSVAEDTRAARRAALAAGAEASAADVLAEADGMLAAASEALAAGDHAAATAGFESARQGFASAAARARAQLAAAREAGAARRGRLADLAPGGCGAVAPALRQACGRAQAALDEGDAKIAALDASAALSFFDRAEEGLAALAQANAAAEALLAERARAKAAGDEARAARAEVMRSAACDDLVEAERAACSEAEAALAAGDRALAGDDLPAALRAYLAARDGFRRTDGSATVQLPPSLVRRVPVEARVSSARGRTLDFEVEVRDPNADPLAYRWLVDGRAIEAGGARLHWPVTGSADVRVEVRDGRGGVLQESWRVEALNRPPQLEISPGDVTLRLGQSQRFMARVEDPDGQTVSVRFSDGTGPKASGEAYLFQATQPGVHVVSARATDSEGAAVTVERIVTVLEDAAPVVVPAAGSRAGQAPAEVASGVLQQYESAYEAGDIDALAGVWEMTEQQRHNMRNFFAESRDIVLDIEQGRALEDGPGGIRVDFEQKVRARGIPAVQVSFTADLVERAGVWRIREIRPRR